MCVAYAVKEVVSFRGLGQLMGVVHIRMYAQSYKTDKQEESYSYLCRKLLT